MMRGTCVAVRELLADPPKQAKSEAPADPKRFAPEAYLLRNVPGHDLAAAAGTGEDARDTVLESVRDPRATAAQIVARTKRVLEIMQEQYGDIPGDLPLADFRAMAREESPFSRLLDDALQNERLRTATVGQWMQAMRTMARLKLR